ncbi:hypothetical protein C8J56DRAFT_950193 [Mycena floridula]|nr:hypothetical protein C8J56DRAFT_950193 [Mycena floridula]
MATNSRPEGLSFLSLSFLIISAVLAILIHKTTFRLAALAVVIITTSVNISYQLSIDLIVETIVISIVSHICFHDGIDLGWIVGFHFIATLKLVMVAVLWIKVLIGGKGGNGIVFNRVRQGFGDMLNGPEDIPAADDDVVAQTVDGAGSVVSSEDERALGRMEELDCKFPPAYSSFERY